MGKERPQDTRDNCDGTPRAKPKAQKKTVASQEKTFATAVKVCYILNFRALSYIMPPMPGFAAGAGSGAGMSVIAHSLVRMRAAILAAF